LENIMGQIEDLQTFLRIVDQGSISKAAEKIGIAKSAVSRRLSLLEERYDARLIDRTPGVWALTGTGQELYQRASRVVTEMGEIESDFVNTSANISGPLSVSVPREFGLNYLNDALLAFKATYPEIQLTIDFDDRTVDLNLENYDFALRITSITEPSENATQIGTVSHHLFASEQYLQSHPAPMRLEDLHNHDLLYFGDARRTVWEFGEIKGRPQKIEFQPYLNSNSGIFLRNATIQGLGISRLPYFIASQAIECGDLVEVLSDFQIPDWGIFLIHPEKRLLNKRMRLFSEMMTQACLRKR
jgi:DNA-binding transcriptional LysR family regulator